MLQYRYTTLLVDSMIFFISLNSAHYLLSSKLELGNEGLASDRALMGQVTLDASIIDVLLETDLGHTLLLIALNLAYQLFQYLAFRSLPAAEESEAAITARESVARVMAAALRTDTYENVLPGCDEVLACSICLLDFDSQDSVTQLNCNAKHIFHEACLRRALEVKLSCPICRKPVLDERLF